MLTLLFIQNFSEYVSLYPEFKHVFVGDNGQGDVKAAEMMAEKFPESIEAIYMHRVRGGAYSF